jgi:hypothetical protein
MVFFGMSIMKTATTVLVPSVEEVPRISDAEREDLIASLKRSRADIAAGNFDVLTPGTLRKEFDAILEDDMSDEALDALLGILSPPSR